MAEFAVSKRSLECVLSETVRKFRCEIRRLVNIFLPFYYSFFIAKRREIKS